MSEMRVRLEKKFRFEAAHWLPEVEGEHKCRRIHGHGFTVEIAVEGEVKPEKGWLIDFNEITEAWEPLQAELDHKYLNEIEGLESPTSENLSFWICASIRTLLACVQIIICQVKSKG